MAITSEVDSARVAHTTGFLPIREIHLERSCMNPLAWSFRSTAFLFVMLLGASCAGAQNDPLPSWNDGPAKQAILADGSSWTVTSQT
jgi:hypothetical protein